jgi:hypothetical protein
MHKENLIILSVKSLRLSLFFIILITVLIALSSNAYAKDFIVENVTDTIFSVEQIGRINMSGLVNFFKDVFFNNMLNITASSGDLITAGIIGVTNTGSSYILGNLGIGTTNPSYELTVNGNINVSGSNNLLTLGWGNLTGYPSACSSSQYISAFGDSLTCAPISITESQISDLSHTVDTNETIRVDNIINNYIPDNISNHEATFKHGNTTTEIRSQFSGSNNITINNGIISFNLTCIDITGSADLCDGNDATGDSSKWIDNGIYISPNSSFASIVNASTFTSNWGTNITGNSIYSSNVYSDKVGVGTTSPSYLLQVADTTGAGLSLNVSDVLYVNGSSGRVGIGTTSPGAKLEVSGTIKAYESDGNIIQSTGYGYSPSAYRAVQIGKLAGPQDSISIALGIDPSTITGGAFYGNEIALPNTVEFMQANSGGTDWIQNVLVLNNGNVGIGTTSPSGRLEVKGPGVGNWVMHAVASDGSSLGGIYEGGSGQGEFYLRDAGGTTKIRFNTAGDSYFNQGKVGIGTTSPTSKLQVNGTITAWGMNVNTTNVCLEDGTNCPAGASSSSPWTNDSNYIYPASGYPANVNVTGNLAVSENATVKKNIDVTNGSLWQPVYGTDDDLVLYLPFSEGTGTITYDRSPYGNDGSISGATWASGKYGSALKFDGVNDNVNLGDTTSLRINTSMSIESWVLSNGSQTGTGIIISKYGTDRGYYLGIESAGNSAVFSLSSSASGGTDSISGTINVNEWTHVVGTYDGSTMFIYINGVLKQSTSHTGIYNTTATVFIGKLDIGSNWLNGTIDEVKIYKRALTPEEIRTHYLRGKSFRASGAITADKFRVVNTSASKIFEINQTGVAISPGGVQRLTIDSSGNVGIGTASPLTSLHVKGDYTLFENTPLRITPLAPPGELNISLTPGGSLSNGTYTARVMAVTSGGAEGLKSSQASITITDTNVTNGIRTINISWNAVSGASSYHVYLWNNSQGSILNTRYYITNTTSISITTNPVSPPTGLTATPTTGGTLNSGTWSFWVTGIFPDGQTVYSYNSTPVIVSIPSVDNGNGMINLSWNPLTNAIGYRLYIGGEHNGGTRPALQYIETTDTNLSYTGQATTFAFPFGNEDLEASALGIFGSIRTTANVKSIFAADILINGDVNSEAVFQANRANAGNSLAGIDLRTNSTPKWRFGLKDSTDDLILYLSNPPSDQDTKTAYFKQTTGDFYLYRNNAGTDDNIYPLRFRRGSSATVSDGFGAGISWDLEVADGTLINAGIFTSNWADATNNISEFRFNPRSSSGSFPQVLTIKGDGTVGIGVTNPSYLLEVADTTTGAGLSMNVSGVLFVNGSSDSVGIGTGGPKATLHVTSAAIDHDSPTTILQSTGRSSTRIKSADAVTNAITVLTNVATTLMLENSNLTNNAWSFIHWPSKTLRNNAGAAIGAQYINNTAGEMELAFFTTPTGDNGIAERMRIDSSGNIGIGTSSPSEKLNINGSLRIDNSSGASVLYVNTTSGRVGIGTTNPSSELHIIGSMNVTQNITVGDSIKDSIGNSSITFRSNAIVVHLDG